MRERVGVILAGGKSRRMGKEKAFLEIAGVPLIQRTIRALSPFFLNLAVVTKDVEPFRFLDGVYRVQDAFTEQHALGGITTALTAFPGKDCFVFACDMPSLNPRLIRHMLEERSEYDVLAPQSDRGLEPLHAIYTGRCLDRIASCIREKKWNLEAFVRMCRYRVVGPETVRALDPDGLSFVNVNTPEEFQKWERGIPQNLV